jgi:hypothetical protein
MKIILKEREHKEQGLGRLASIKTSINELKVTFHKCAARRTIYDVYAQEVAAPSTACKAQSIDFE